MISFCLILLYFNFSLSLSLQIVIEEFLEDINNMLNSGEVPNLFAADEYEQILQMTRPKAKDAGISEQDRYGQ